MALHSKNIAISAGVPTHLVEEASQYMIATGQIEKDAAQSYMKAHNIYSTIRQRKRSKEVFLSTFYVQLKSKSMENTIFIQIVFDCFSEDPIHLSIEEKKPEARKRFQDI